MINITLLASAVGREVSCVGEMGKSHDVAQNRSYQGPMESRGEITEYENRARHRFRMRWEGERKQLDDQRYEEGRKKEAKAGTATPCATTEDFCSYKSYCQHGHATPFTCKLPQKKKTPSDFGRPSPTQELDNNIQHRL